MKQALLFANRSGLELAPLNQVFPPALLPIGGKPVLEHALALIQRTGITDVFLVVDHHSELIKKHFGNGEKWSLSLHYISALEYEPVNHVRARIGVRLVEPFLAGRGDVWHEELRLNQETDWLPGFAEITERGASMKQAHWPAPTKADASWLDSLQAFHTLALRECLPAWHAKRSVTTQNPVCLGALSEVHPTSLGLGKTSVGDYTKIERGAYLEGDNAIGHRCLISRGAKLHNAVVLDQTFIGPGMLVENAIVHQGVIIKPELGVTVTIEDEFFISSTRLSSVNDMLTNTLEKVMVLVLWQICFRHLSPQQIWQVLTGKLQLFGRDTRIADGATEDQKTLPWIAAYQKVPEGAISPARLVYPDCREFEILTLAEIELHHPRSIQSLAIYARMALKCPRGGTLRQNNPTPIVRG